MERVRLGGHNGKNGRAQIERYTGTNGRVIVEGLQGYEWKGKIAKGTRVRMGGYEWKGTRVRMRREDGRAHG